MRLAVAKPTFQWIEAAGMNCAADPALTVTPQTVHAEAWLAILGGAHGLGFFPAAWTGDVGGAISRIAAEVAALEPVLLGTSLPGVGADGAIHAAAWKVDGALYAAAVNTGTAVTRATLHLPGLDGRRLEVLEEGRSVSAAGDSVRDRFAPLEVHLYVAPPPAG